MKENKKQIVLKADGKEYRVVILKNVAKEVKEFLYSFADVYYDTEKTYYIVNNAAFLFFEDMRENDIILDETLFITNKGEFLLVELASPDVEFYFCENEKLCFNYYVEQNGENIEYKYVFEEKVSCYWYKDNLIVSPYVDEQENQHRKIEWKGIVDEYCYYNKSTGVESIFYRNYDSKIDFSDDMDIDILEKHHLKKANFSDYDSCYKSGLSLLKCLGVDFENKNWIITQIKD